MLCPYCRKEHPKGALYCPETGGPLPGAPGSSTTTPMYTDAVDTIPLDSVPAQAEPAGAAGYDSAPPYAPYAAAPDHSPAGLRWALIGLAAFLVLAAGACVFLMTGGVSAVQNLAEMLKAGDGLPIGEMRATEAADRPTKRAMFPPAGAEATETIAPAHEVEADAGTPNNGAPEAAPAPGDAATSAGEPSATPTLEPTPVPTLTRTPEPVKLYSGWFAYAYGEDNLREIFVMNPASGETRQITSNTWTEEWPTFSPDNRHMAYASFRDAGWQIYVMDLETRSEKQITHFDGQARCPQWSPAPGSERILFEGRTGATGNMLIDIWGVDADGKNLKRLTSSTADIRPRWSPDGAKFVTGRALADTNQDGRIRTSDNLDVFMIDLATGAETRITGTPENDDFQFAWSPDGQTLAVASVRGDVDGNGVRNLDDAQGLYLIPVSGGRERFLDMNDLHVFSPDWSPDGGEIVFIADVGTSNEIWVYSVESGEVKRLSKAGPYYHTAWAR